MRLVIQNLKQTLDTDDGRLSERIAAQYGIDGAAIHSVRVLRRSIDARKKQEVHFLLHVVADIEDADAKHLLKSGGGQVALFEEKQQKPLQPGTQPQTGRIIVAGLGPAGLFAAHLLARHGYRPLVVERGESVERRTEKVARYWTVGELDESSNVMFGEGGAGTFSDGKLTSRSKDARADAVLHTLVHFGAPEDVTVAAKPHIGTDRLRCVVSAMRRDIEALGGEVLFQTRLDGLEIKDGRVIAARLICGDKTENVPCSALVLATGQGARDTYEMLFETGAMMAKKPFAVGVRIEHPQSMIDRVQYGAFAGHARLGAAEYRLTAKSGTRGVYTFCMCPGGKVIASASARDEVVVNGMSDYARDGENANAAIVVQVRADDLPDDPLAGMRFQKRMEQAAFRAGGSCSAAPASTVGAFLKKQVSAGFGEVRPSYLPGVTQANLWEVLPPFVARGVGDGIIAFGRQLKGFDRQDAVLTGVETRTSAPLRILRDENMESVSIRNVYPTGEGAGYAGGIVSAAIDGLKAAEKIIERFAPPKT
jgi:uncharacterized FAD-dependent dehydrogenase